MKNSSRVILDLCGGTGAWSKPYKDAGYDVRLITTPQHDVRTFQHIGNVHGILAAPPCEHFALSGAQYWPRKDEDGSTVEALAVVDACLRIIITSRPVWWALENAVGRLVRWLGPPALRFHPYEYGDPYKKRTVLWGNFKHPVRTPVEPEQVCAQGSWVQLWGGGVPWRTKMMRSITPPGFAKAFFLANP